jgi:hypothetical protein
LDKDKLYIKILKLNETYNFVVKKFVLKLFRVSIFKFSYFEIQIIIFLKDLDVNMVYPNAAIINTIYNFVVGIFYL